MSIEKVPEGFRMATFYSFYGARPTRWSQSRHKTRLGPVVISGKRSITNHERSIMNRHHYMMDHHPQQGHPPDFETSNPEWTGWRQFLFYAEKHEISAKELLPLMIPCQPTGMFPAFLASGCEMLPDWTRCRVGWARCSSWCWPRMGNWLG